MNILNKSDYNIIRKKFNNKPDKYFNDINENILNLLEKTELITVHIINKGFNKDFTNINYKLWFNYIITLIKHIDNFKNLKGKQKLDFLLLYCVYIIIRFFPVNNDSLKDKIIDIIIDMIPDIAESVINVSKKLHTGLKYIIKKSLKIKCCSKQKE